jgi:Tol biopolymer transport system component
LQDLPRIDVSYTHVLSTDSFPIGMSALSPDGRWIVFGSSPTEGESNLSIVSTDGGDPFRLVSGTEYVDGPVWFPSGERVAFRHGSFISSLAIDPATGRPAGTVQRITIEPNNAYFDISPDGEWIAYTPMDEEGDRVIRIVPSNGGIARTVAKAQITRPAWAPDGNSIYYAIERADSPGQVLMRIAVEDGEKAEGAEPEEVFSHAGHIGTVTCPGSGFAWLSAGAGRTVITTLEGEALGTVELEEGMRIRAFSSDGRTLLIERRGSSVPIRMAPVAGGTARTLLESDTIFRDEPRALAWAPNGQEVLVEAPLEGSRRLFLVPPSSGIPTEIPIQEERARFGMAGVHFSVGHSQDPVLSADGRHLLYAIPGSVPGRATLKVMELETGRATTLTTSFPRPGKDMPGRVLGPGGAINRDEDEFFFWEKAGGELVLKASTGAGDSRILRAFEEPGASFAVAIHGNRIVYVSYSAAETTVFLTEPGGGGPRSVLTVDGFLDIIAWSPNGRWLAATHWSPEEDQARLMLIPMSEEGTVEGEPRVLGPASWAWWGHQWLPDNSGFLTGGSVGEVWFIPVDPMTEPVPITEEVEGSIEDFVLSPDGTQIAYPWFMGDVHFLWLAHLEDVRVRGRR